MSDQKERYIVPTGYIVNGYKIVELIAIGQFGGIYQVKNKKSNNIYVMKTESFDSDKFNVPVEIKVLKELKGSNFPKYHDAGNCEKFQMNYVIMNNLGANLSEIQMYHGHRLNIELVYNLAYRMLWAIRVFHSIGYVHGDIKPSNFLLQQNPKYPVALIDFNTTTRFINPETKELLPMKKLKKCVGTKKYASINALQLYSTIPSDDLISWFYSFLDLAIGYLPWEDEKDTDKAIQMRENLKLSDFSYKLPKEFQQINDYLNKLRFDEKPDYDLLANLFKDGMKSDSCDDPEKYDFTEFIKKHTNMINFKEKISKMSIKYITEKTERQRIRKLREQRAHEKEDEDDDSENSSKKSKKHNKNCLIQ